MSKLTLEFMIPEEQTDAIVATKAYSLLSVINELDDYLRSINKHGHEDFPDPSGCEAAQKIRDKLHELIKDANLEEVIY